MRQAVLFASVLSIVCPVAVTAASEKVDSVRNGYSLVAGSVEVVLRSGPYRFVEERGGRKIEMAGFDYLKEPGRPMLPEKSSLVLLPPGAESLSVEIEELGAEQLPGEFVIAPTPPLVALSGPLTPLGAVVYTDDRAYPAEVARIVGSGSLRKYSYVRVSFCPFTYHAQSGRLIHHDTARIRVHYTLPDPAGEKARITAQLLSDTVADERAARLFVNYDDLSDLYEPEEPAEELPTDLLTHYDYVIVTTADHVDAIAASGFTGWKSSLGFDVRVVLTTDPEIASQSGADLAERIRNFLRAKLGTWGIEYVLLVGGIDDIPMRYCYPDPENHWHDPADPGVGPGSVPTDAYYADLSLSDDASWDLDGDGFHGEYGQDNPDFLAEVSVGRIPTSDNARITYTLAKLVSVEQDSGPWKRHALHAGAILFFENQNGSGIPLRDGAVTVDEIESNFMQGWVVSRYSEQEGLVLSPYPWPALTQVAFTMDWINGTHGFVNWAGHGWPDGVYRTVWSWDDGDGIPETDGSDGMSSIAFITEWPVLDDDHPSIVCAVSCNVGYPEPNPYGNLGLNLLTDPNMGGASGVMSSTRYAAVSFDWPAMPGGAESLCYEFNRYLIDGPGGARRLGDAVYESKFFAHVNYGWESDYEYRNQYNYNLFGDPAMDWRGAGPRTGNLLRNTDVTQLEPVTPPLGDCLPLDPADDLYIPDFVAGNVDSDPAGESPLVFYAIDDPVRIWLSKTPTGEIQIDF